MIETLIIIVALTTLAVVLIWYKWKTSKNHASEMAM
jgi:hypothetical protein